MTGPRRRDKAATRAALLEAARSRFAEHGYDGTGVREIAAEAGVDPTLIFRYFGSKKDLFAEVIGTDAPAGVGGGDRDPSAQAAELLRRVVFADGHGGSEHPLLVMLRSAGRPEVRARLREQVCADYLGDLAERFDGEDPDLRAELVAALLVGLGLMRSVVGTPALAEASFQDTAGLVAAMVAALREP